jgi:subtilisin family serine protease
MKISKISLFAIALTLGLASCKTINIAEVAGANEVVSVSTKAELSKDEADNYQHYSLLDDKISGVSANKAHKALEGMTPTTVIVAVVDSGMDIEHEDLKNVIWTNEDEIAGNGIDDDKNGFVDDIHGWNFLGEMEGANLEVTRLYKKLKPLYEGKKLTDIPAEKQAEFKLYEKVKEEYQTEFEQANTTYGQYKMMSDKYEEAKAAITKELGKEDYTLEEVTAIETEDGDFKKQIGLYAGMTSQGVDSKRFARILKYFKSKLDYYLNVDTDFRAVLHDNPEDINDTNYGNNDIIGNKETEEHATHVAGIIGAERNNGIGMNGIAANVKIMAVRVVPDGDENDKDVALGIRYAVDNGAKVINMSFGKTYSPHRGWVADAIKYAAKHDVLLVKAAGNDNTNVDGKLHFPTDVALDGVTEIADNVISVGASTPHFNENLPTTFSNYGQTRTDVFAPGFQVYSTIPNNKYDHFNGTSMASPVVAGVAAVIRAYFPKLTAAQVKQIILLSGNKTDMDVNLPVDAPEDAKKVPFTTISKTGTVVNLYRAIELAKKVSK